MGLERIKKLKKTTRRKMFDRNRDFEDVPYLEWGDDGPESVEELERNNVNPNAPKTGAEEKISIPRQKNKARISNKIKNKKQKILKYLNHLAHKK